MSHQIWIPGKPVAKRRPRFARRGKFVVTYSDQETEEGRFLWELRQQWKDEPLIGPLYVTMTFIMPIPKSFPKKKVEAFVNAEEAGEGIAHMVKPDLDNLIKFSKDCMNGVIWHDDAQVAEINARKEYGSHPGTRIQIYPIQAGRS